MDLAAIADQFFARAAAADIDEMSSLCAADCRVTQNVGTDGGLDQLRRLVERITAAGVAVAYSDVRRVVAADAVVEQHLVTLTRADGVAATSDVCVVLRFDHGGHITSLDEYVDSAAFAAIFD